MNASQLGHLLCLEGGTHGNTRLTNPLCCPAGSNRIWWPLAVLGERWPKEVEGLEASPKGRRALNQLGVFVSAWHTLRCTFLEPIALQMNLRGLKKKSCLFDGNGRKRKT